MKYIYIYILSMLFSSVLSCSNRGPYDSKNQSIQRNDTITKSLIQDSTITISKIEDILEAKGLLSGLEYTVICRYILNDEGKNEDESEEIGYLLFNYFRGSKNNNEAFSSFLAQKYDNNKKEAILYHLVQSMCIDISEENYTYEKLKQDFSFFMGSISAKKAFDECLKNQVY